MTELGDKIVSLRAQGMTYSQIISETGAAKSTVAYYCGAGVKEKVYPRTKDKRNKIIRYIQGVKQASPCADCGENYPYWMMDFDHVRGEKEFNISMHSSVTATLEKVKEEIAKCDLVCANCHRNRTHMRLVRTGDSLMDVSEFYE